MRSCAASPTFERQAWEFTWPMTKWGRLRLLWCFWVIRLWICQSAFTWPLASPSWNHRFRRIKFHWVYQSGRCCNQEETPKISLNGSLSGASKGLEGTQLHQCTWREFLTLDCCSFDHCGKGCSSRHLHRSTGQSSSKTSTSSRCMSFHASCKGWRRSQAFWVSSPCKWDSLGRDYSLPPWPLHRRACLQSKPFCTHCTCKRCTTSSHTPLGCPN